MQRVILVVLINLIFSCNSIKPIKNSSNDYSIKLIGIWNFVEMRNSKGEKIDFYNAGFAVVKATGPQIFYYKDKTYKKIFVPDKADTGFWHFNEETMTIEYDLFIDSTDWIGKDLIKNGLAVKQSDGNYYERVTDKVLKFNDRELILNRRGYQSVFKKE